MTGPASSGHPSYTLLRNDVNDATQGKPEDNNSASTHTAECNRCEVADNRQEDSDVNEENMCVALLAGREQAWKGQENVTLK